MDYSDTREFFKPSPPVFVMYPLEMLSKMNLTEDQLKHIAALQAECYKLIMRAQAEYFRKINEMLK